MGDPSQDPGCDKCRRDAEEARSSKARSFPAPTTVPDWFGAFIARVQQEQGGIDWDAALRAIMRRWNNGGGASDSRDTGTSGGGA
jgi:hypothetical protein